MKNKIDNLVFHFPTVFKDMDMKKGIVTGFFSSFNTWDHDNEMVMPGAFKKSLMEQGPQSQRPRIKHLLNHDTDKALGLPLLIEEQSQGAYYESQVGSHDLGVDFLKMVDSGLITEHSFGGRIIRKEIINPDADWRDQKRKLHEILLFEFSSLTAWGANPYTPLTAVKDMKTVEERIDKVIKALRNGTFTDQTFQFLEHELLFLQKAFNDFTTPPEDDDIPSTEPGRKKKFAGFLKSINKTEQ